MEAEKVLKKRGARITCALIEDYNSGSMELFEKCGYVEDRNVTYFSKRESNKV